MILLPMKYKTKGKSFVVRTIRNKYVRINGYIFESRDQPVIPELNGRRCVFNVYWTGSWKDTRWQMENRVCLWGSEEMYYCVDEDSWNKAYSDWYKIITDKDNFIRFMWWDLSRIQSVAFRKRRRKINNA